jgi:hypothetical protein
VLARVLALKPILSRTVFKPARSTKPLKPIGSKAAFSSLASSLAAKYPAMVWSDLPKGEAAGTDGTDQRLA